MGWPRCFWHALLNRTVRSGQYLYSADGIFGLAVMRLVAMICLVLGPLIAAPVLALAGRPLQSATTFLVVGPMDGLPEILRRAGGRPIGPTGAPIALLAVAGSQPESFPARLRMEGAWLVLDGAIAAQLCGV